MVLSGNKGPSNAFREARNPAPLVLLLAGVALLLAACSQPTPDATATLAADTPSGIEADRQAPVYQSAHTQGPPPTPPVYADTYADCLQKSYDVDAEIDRLATAQNEGKVLADGQVLEAVRAGSRASVENVLKELPDVNIPVFYGTDTPLHLAAQHNPNPEAVALLLDRGADIHAQTLGLTTLHWAVGGVVNPKLEVVALLLDRGADVNAKDSDGAKYDDVGTPLHLAATGSDTEMVALLLDWGADLHAKNGWGQTPLHEAARIYNNPEVVALLLDWGADIHAKNDESETPLHEAAKDGNVEEAALLLDHDANIHAKNIWGRTPLHLAVQYNPNPEVVALLLDRGADIHTEDIWGRTPCRVAQDWIAYFAGTPELERLCAP